MKRILLSVICFAIVFSQEGCSIFQSKFTKAKHELVEKIVSNPDSIDQYCRESILQTESYLKNIQVNDKKKSIIDD